MRLYKITSIKWISREEFFEKKEDNIYIKIIWSFGNNGMGYIFGKDIEQYKKSFHQAIIFNEFDDTAIKIFGIKNFKEETSIYERRSFLRNRIIILNKNKKRGELERLQVPPQLQQLERLEQLQQLERLHYYNKSYEQIEINPNSVIYCDIPYKRTAEYDKNNSFDRYKFFDWANCINHPVYISEYNIDDKRFKEIYSIKKMSKLSCLNRENKDEKIYINKYGLEQLRKK